MVNRIRKFVDRNNLLSQGERVLVALSGGADSVCLLHVLLQLKSVYALEIDAVHVNHMLRGDEAERDAQFCKDLCAKLGVHLHMCKEDVNAYAQKTKQSIEAAAREVRYAAFSRLQQAYRYAKIAVAHHANDNAETMLMHLLRGSGLDGLRGILPKRDCIIRPLLEISREEVLDYLERAELDYVTDSTNAQTQYARNHIRHALIGQIEADYNPNIVNTLSETAYLLRVDAAYMDAQALHAQEKLVTKQQNGVLLDASGYGELPEAIALRVMKAAISVCIGKTQDIPFDTILRAHTMCLECMPGKRLDLPEGATAVMEHDGLYMTKQSLSKDYAYTLEIGESLTIPMAGVRICAQLTDSACAEDANTVCFDYDSLPQPLVVRNRRSGDHVCFKGMTGEKKLKDYFIDEKIAKHVRDVLPLVCAGDEILWICARRKCARYAVNKDTEKVLMLTCEGIRT